MFLTSSRATIWWAACQSDLPDPGHPLLSLLVSSWPLRSARRAPSEKLAAGCLGPSEEPVLLMWGEG